jgi:hypothetical protein
MKRVMQSAIEQQATSDTPKRNFMRSPENPDPPFPKVIVPNCASEKKEVLSD